MSDQRIYVASLSDYNAGRLHGVHIDMGDAADIDEVWGKVNAMLAASPEYRALPQGGPAEEWAIHDYEGFGGWRLSEYENLEKVLMVANLIANKGEAFSVWVGNDESVLDGDYADVEEAFDEAYVGETTLAEYAEQLVDDCGWNGVDADTIKKLGGYFDYAAVARNLELNGELWESGGHLFRST